jgi:type I restriction enzyme S subunit
MINEDWVECTFGDLLDYEQPTKYIVKSTKYSDSYKTPVLTAGKSFIKGYTNEEDGIFENLPTIIFDDFTTATQFVNFKFKVKSSAMKILVPTSKLVNMTFVYYCIQVNRIRSDTHKRYWISVYAKKKFLLPSLVEQKAIVTKIENLFHSLDSGIADLKKAQAQLKIYRQAVLKKAFEGELTKEWRAQQKDLPSAEELLEEIKIEREKYYEGQLEEWKKAVEIWEENGKVGRKPSKPRALKDVENFTQEELADFSKLPNNWKWVKLGNIFQVFIGSTPTRNKSEYWENGNINWVSSGEVAFNKIFETKEKITQLGLSKTSTKVHPQGTVMLAMIGEGKTRGQAAILETNACHNQNTAAIRVSEIGFNSKYLFHYFFLKYERNRRVGSGNNQKALNQGRILNFDFPLCSKKEQNQILKEIESRLSVCDQVEATITESLQKSEALRQSILKQAFEGKLLSEEEIAACKGAKDYEAAGVLLERIKAEKK